MYEIQIFLYREDFAEIIPNITIIQLAITEKRTLWLHAKCK